MLLTITLTIAFLVAINFMLLFWSTNKIEKKKQEKTEKKPYTLKPTIDKPKELAATGS